MTNRYTLQELLAKSGEKKRIEVPYEDGIVEMEITPVTFGPVSRIQNDKTDDTTMTREMIKTATGLTDEQIDKLPLGFVPALGEAISKASGLDKVTQKRAERFPSPQKEN
ncbi:hypothetical protein DRJ17_00825 [Candidatus Woesearchaeota archaeon]|nr:MAG: hypothetical protein DRJ17_00825 [Candidatus Woesearchaeota archaeon]